MVKPEAFWFVFGGLPVNVIPLGRKKPRFNYPSSCCLRLYTKVLSWQSTEVSSDSEVDDRTFVTNSLVRLFKLTTDKLAFERNFNRTIVQNNIIPIEYNTILFSSHILETTYLLFRATSLEYLHEY